MFFLKNVKKQNDLKKYKIKKMLDYAYNIDKCKRNFILNYFGEKFNNNCNNCSAKSCNTINK